MFPFYFGKYAEMVDVESTMGKNGPKINQYVHTAENVQFLHGYGASDGDRKKLSNPPH